MSDMTRLSICSSGAAEARKSSGRGSFTAYPLSITKMSCCRKLGLLHMVLLALALRALSTYFGVAFCNTGCGRKQQNQYSIRLLAPIDNGSYSFYIS
jgi:hypothetical protein